MLFLDLCYKGRTGQPHIFTCCCGWLLFTYPRNRRQLQIVDAAQDESHHRWWPCICNLYYLFSLACDPFPLTNLHKKLEHVLIIHGLVMLVMHESAIMYRLVYTNFYGIYILWHQQTGCFPNNHLLWTLNAFIKARAVVLYARGSALLILWTRKGFS